MTAIAYSNGGFSKFLSPSTLGISEAAGTLKQRVVQLIEHYESAASADIYEIASQAALKQLYEECAVGDWGGNNEFPISNDVYIQAKVFLRNLPTRFQRPEIVAEPNGSIAFEWNPVPFNFVILSFSGSRKIEFAAAFGKASKVYGSILQIENKIPRDIMNMLGNIIKE